MQENLNEVNISGLQKLFDFKQELTLITQKYKYKIETPKSVELNQEFPFKVLTFNKFRCRWINWSHK